MEAYLDIFLSLRIDRSEWPFTRQDSFIPGRTAPVFFESETDAVQNHSGRFGIEKYLVPFTGTDSLIFGHPTLTLFLLPITLSQLPNFYMLATGNKTRLSVTFVMYFCTSIRSSVCKNFITARWNFSQFDISHHWEQIFSHYALFPLKIRLHLQKYMPCCALLSL